MKKKWLIQKELTDADINFIANQKYEYEIEPSQTSEVHTMTGAIKYVRRPMCVWLFTETEQEETWLLLYFGDAVQQDETYKPQWTTKGGWFE